MKDAMQKPILFTMRHAPFGNHLAQESLEALLAMAMFEQNLSALWLDDGVFQIIESQNSSHISQKSLSTMSSSLELYGLENRYVCKESLKTRGLLEHQLAIDAILLSSQDVRALLQKQQQIISF